MLHGSVVVSGRSQVSGGANTNSEYPASGLRMPVADRSSVSCVSFVIPATPNENQSFGWPEGLIRSVDPGCTSVKNFVDQPLTIVPTTEIEPV